MSRPDDQRRDSDPASTTTDREDPDSVVGQIVGGNFRVIRLIGSGAMGNVYQAEQLSLSKMVALKLLRRELMGDDRLIKRFELEARNASSLNHPNSIQIIDFGRDGELLFIAMELLAGIDLAQLLARDGEQPLARIGRIMDQVLAALDEAHAQGIVHRDLKPSNIMLIRRREEPDFVKVCDFGIAKAQTTGDGAGLTMKGLVCGTPEYMSPEQARGEPVDGRSDLYAAAVILYELLVGTVPFAASSPVGILSKHLGETATAPSVRRPERRIPALLESLVVRGLAKNPAERPQTATEFRQQLRAAMTGIVERWGGKSEATPIVVPVATLLSHGAVTQQTPATQRLGRLRLGGAILAGAALGLFAVVQLKKPEPPVEAMAPRPAPTAMAVTASTPLPPHEEPEPQPQAEPVEPTMPRATAKRRPHRVAVAAARPRPAAVTTLIVPAPAPAPTPSPAPVVQPPPPAPVGPEEVMKEAERLLAMGEVAAACRKGEEARRMNPKLPATYKFLGKCYMRAGKHEPAKQSYSKYLELAPDAADAAFFKSIIQ